MFFSSIGTFLNNLKCFFVFFLNIKLFFWTWSLFFIYYWLSKKKKKRVCKIYQKLIKCDFFNHDRVTIKLKSCFFTIEKHSKLTFSTTIELRSRLKTCFFYDPFTIEVHFFEHDQATIKVPFFWTRSSYDQAKKLFFLRSRNVQSWLFRPIYFCLSKTFIFAFVTYP